MTGKRKKTGTATPKPKEHKSSAASIEDIETEHRRELLEWAVIAHLRKWKTKDEGFMARVCAGKPMCSELVRGIATEYNVPRGIVRRNPDSQTDQPAEDLAKHVYSLAQKWHGSLIERAKLCEETAVDANDNGHGCTHGEQMSAITKLIWFVKPRDWTMFDNLAATALGVSGRKKGKETGEWIKRGTLFYTALSNRNFTSYAKSISAVLAENGFEELYGERVIDKFLWLCGAPMVSSRREIEACREHLRQEKSQKEIKRLMYVAERISTRFSADLLHP